VALAPELGEARAQLAGVLVEQYMFTPATAEAERALALSPGIARVLALTARLLSDMGKTEASLLNARRAVVLDPLNVSSHLILGDVLLGARQYGEAITAYDRAIDLNPDSAQPRVFRGMAELMTGQPGLALEDCATPPIDWANRTCLAIAYHKLNRPADARAALAELKAATGDTASYQFAQVYAQWGDLPRALDSLEMAYQIQDPGLSNLKTDPFLDPLRKEPRFQAMERKLGFPN
jgi:tetratricopeptide (TPR) repeat protein